MTVTSHGYGHARAFFKVRGRRCSVTMTVTSHGYGHACAFFKVWGRRCSVTMTMTRHGYGYATPSSPRLKEGGGRNHDQILFDK